MNLLLCKHAVFEPIMSCKTLFAIPIFSQQREREIECLFPTPGPQEELMKMSVSTWTYIMARKLYDQRFYQSSIFNKVDYDQNQSSSPKAKNTNKETSMSSLIKTVISSNGPMKLSSYCC